MFLYYHGMRYFCVNDYFWSFYILTVYYCMLHVCFTVCFSSNNHYVSISQRKMLCIIMCYHRCHDHYIMLTLSLPLYLLLLFFYNNFQRDSTATFQEIAQKFVPMLVRFYTLLSLWWPNIHICINVGSWLV